MVGGDRVSTAHAYMYYINFLQLLLFGQSVLILIEFLQSGKLLVSSVICMWGSDMATVKTTRAIDSYVW